MTFTNTPGDTNQSIVLVGPAHSAIAAHAATANRTEVIFILTLALCCYVFFVFCLKRICEKCGTNPGLLIWIPVFNTIPLLQAGGLSGWLFLLMLLPVVNVILTAIMWMKISEQRGKGLWLGLLMFVPLVNVLYFLYLAFSE